MTILGKRGVMREFLVETQPYEPAPGQMHAQLLDQLALAGYAIEITDQQDTQEEFRVDGRSADIAIRVLQLLADEVEADVSVDKTQQVVFRNLIFDAEIVEQRLCTRVSSHHDQQASESIDEREHMQYAWSYRRSCKHSVVMRREL